MSYLDELNKYNNLASGFSKFKQLVQQKVQESNNYNKDLLEQKNRLIEEQLSLPQKLREQYQESPITNPLAYENIIAQRNANVGSVLGTVLDLLQARQGDQTAIISSALEGYKAMLDDQARRASAARAASSRGGVGMPMPSTQPATAEEEDRITIKKEPEKKNWTSALLDWAPRVANDIDYGTHTASVWDKAVNAVSPYGTFLGIIGAPKGKRMSTFKNEAANLYPITMPGGGLIRGMDLARRLVSRYSQSPKGSRSSTPKSSSPVRHTIKGLLRKKKNNFLSRFF